MLLIYTFIRNTSIRKLYPSSFYHSPFVLNALWSQRVCCWLVSLFLGKQILSFIVSEEAFTKNLVLNSEIIDILNCFTGQPLSSGQMLEQYSFSSGDRLADWIKSLFGIDLFDNPYGVRVQGGCDWHLLLPAELWTTHWTHWQTLKIELHTAILTFLSFTTVVSLILSPKQTLSDECSPAASTVNALRRAGFLSFDVVTA